MVAASATKASTVDLPRELSEANADEVCLAGANIR